MRRERRVKAIIDLKVLQILKYRNEYYKVIGRVPKESIEPTTAALLKDFGKYFEHFPEHQRVDLQTFAPLFSSWHPKLDKEQKNAYATILRKVNIDVPESEQQVVLQALLELRLSSDVAGLLMKFEEGELANIAAALDETVTQFRLDAKVNGLDYLRDPIGDLLDMEANDEGLRWRLSCLNQSMRGLRDGDFGIIAARPDKGKTTLVCSEVTYLAAQDPRPVVWLNNEGPGNRIRPRLFQAALGITLSEAVQQHQQGRLVTNYEAAIKGDQFKIRIFDIHGMDTYAVERIVEQNEPSIVVYDMIDNVRGFGDSARTDLALERMYQWARELCVKYGHAGIATSQVSADGADIQFPADHMLKDSKTGKQGACDFIMMSGAIPNPGFESSRFIGLPKNKLRREGGPADPKEQVHYKPHIARYEDATHLETPADPDEALDEKTDN